MVSYQFSPNWKSFSFWRSKKIRNPKNGFYADPFLFQSGERNYCFVEEYDYDNKKGHISVIEITPKGYTPLGKVLEEDFHLSFPFVFQYEDQIFMCPETQDVGQIRL